MPSNKIYKIANEIAPDRASQGDQMDMKINAIIKYLDSASSSSTGLSTPITNTIVETPFDKTLVIPAFTLTPGRTLNVKALFQTTTAAAASTFRIRLKYTPAGGAAVTWADLAGLDPADGAINAYMLDMSAIVKGTGAFMASTGGKVWDYTAGAATIIDPTVGTANMALNATLANTLSLTIEWSAADVANIITLHTFTYTIN